MSWNPCFRYISPSLSDYFLGEMTNKWNGGKKMTKQWTWFALFQMHGKEKNNAYIHGVFHLQCPKYPPHFPSLVSLPRFIDSSGAVLLTKGAIFFT
jgi:hypothetical protein